MPTPTLQRSNHPSRIALRLERLRDNRDGLLTPAQHAALCEALAAVEALQALEAFDEALERLRAAGRLQ